MGFCRSAVCVLIFLLYLNGIVCAAASAEVTVKAYLNDSATLPCSGQNSGTVMWVMLQKSDYVVARCNHTSCWSEDGFEVSHDEYLNGTFSLNITAVEHNNAGLYQCQDDHKIISDVRLQIESIPYISMDRYHSVVLPCQGICPGLVTWFRNGKPSDILAECNQTSCRSVKEGYQMIHDEYLQGNLSLIITEVDFSQRGEYTCLCDHLTIFRVQLLINSVNSPVHIQSGDSLVLALDLHDPLEVIYNSSGAVHQTSVQICTLYGRLLRCIDKYKNRVFLHSALELSGMNVSDSGVYTIRTIENKEDIHIYTVNVTDYQRPPVPPPLDGKAGYIIPLFISVIVNVIFGVALCVMYRQRKKANVTCVLINRCGRNEDANESTAEEQRLQAE